MKALNLLILFSFFITYSFAQTDTSAVELSPKESKKLMKELSKQFDFKKMERESIDGGITRACTCIDSVMEESLDSRGYNKAISHCIQEQATTVNMVNQLMRATMDIDKKSKKKDRTINITLDDNGSQSEYQKIENGLMDSCTSLKKHVASSDDYSSDKSFSDNERSRYYYGLGEKAFKKKKYDKAIDYYKQSLDIDSNFAWAWDNLGLAYRYKGDYRKAIECYETSLRVDPGGTMPLQNIAVAYSYLKDYDKATQAYENIIQRYPEDPEGYFGKGRMFVLQQKTEEGLDMMCKAYNLYTAQKNPYRADAQKMITYLYVDMKKTRAGKKRFLKILKENNINFEIEK